MGCSRRKLSETGLRIFGTFLKVQLCVGNSEAPEAGASIPDDNRIGKGTGDDSNMILFV